MSKSNQRTYFEAEVPQGLEDIAVSELNDRLNEKIYLLGEPEKGAIRFRFLGKLQEFEHLKTVFAVYHVQEYAIPRPKAFLGHQYFSQLILQIQTARTKTSSKHHYETFHISAAGNQSKIMQRLKDEIAKQTQLEYDDDAGDVLLRIRPSAQYSEGWETLVRMGARPLSTREWRVANMEGALNAVVAQGIIRLLNPKVNEQCANLCCGSGTFLIEHADYQSEACLLGIDISNESLNYSRKNIAASQFSRQIKLVRADVTSLPLPDHSFNILYADLPFGQLIGSHEENQLLYPAILEEAYRITRNEAKFAIITHEVRLLENLLATSQKWFLENKRMITLSGLHPRIFILRRK